MGVILVTATEVITTAFPNDNIDSNLIKPSYIEVAQVEHIRYAIGEELYDEIISQKETNTLTSANQILIAKIKPALCFYVAADVVLHLAIRTSNKGLMVNTSETSREASREERQDIMTRLKEQGQVYVDLTLKYLRNNAIDYPKYFYTENRIKIRGGFIL